MATAHHTVPIGESPAVPYESTGSSGAWIGRGSPTSSPSLSVIVTVGEDAA
ncbi:hypothetical protein [Embleya sp. NBC_00896]|uniref:hypothetical protein n=1 Tax=Embleya sp. NBC_00896 TaxID=2975961 RepID=UPI002F90F763|nr:hypothetical protein OG928_47690 [Embleya sp. NBC_00896]